MKSALKKKLSWLPLYQTNSSCYLHTMDYSMNGESDVEKLVGISSFANAAVGFQGIMKQRYSDFVVREVSTSNQLTVLSDLSPVALENLHFNQNIGSPSTTANNSSEELVESVVTEMSAITSGKFGGQSADPANPTSPEVIEEELRSFLFSCIEKASDCPPSFIACPCPDKPSRTKLHQIVRKYLSTCIESEALEVSGEKFILLRSKHKMEKGSSGEWRSRNKWPANLGNYLQFTLYKENIDSMSAAHHIAKSLASKVDSVQFAGTKDKRAVTTQKITMYRRKPSDLAKLNRFNLPPYVRVGDFEYVHEPLKLGALAGNNFGIIMRDIDASSEDIKGACKAIEKSGFINFYGLQRFGSGGTKSHHCGLALFRRDYKLFIEMLFVVREGDRSEVEDMKAAFHDNDIQRALRVAPARMPTERMVLENLIKKPEDFEGAFHRIPKSQWLMCLHAYQSYIWNMAASERISQQGLSCVEGDLVFIGGSASAVDCSTMLEEECEAVDDVLENDTAAAMTSEVETHENEQSAQIEVITTTTEVKSVKKPETHIVTAEDVASKTYSIFDVVLPLPGHTVILPNNVIGQYMKDLLAKDGLSLEFFGKCLPSEHRMNGAYRPLMQMPKDFEWNFFEYSDPNEELVPTEGSYLKQVSKDKSKRRGDKSLTEVPSDYSTDSKPYPITNLLGFGSSNDPSIYGPGDGTEEQIIVPPVIKTSTLRGLQMKFTLPPGTYATMLLREVTKHSTHSQYQTQLTATAAASVANSVSNSVTQSSVDTARVLVADSSSAESPMKKSRTTA